MEFKYKNLKEMKPTLWCGDRFKGYVTPNEEIVFKNKIPFNVDGFLRCEWVTDFDKSYPLAYGEKENEILIELYNKLEDGKMYKYKLFGEDNYTLGNCSYNEDDYVVWGFT